MLDTVIVTVNEIYYTVMNPDRFSPSTRHLYRDGFLGTNFVNQLKSKTIYYPKLSIRPRTLGKGVGFVRDLRIEFSVAKLVYGNNLQEITTTDKSKVYEILIQRLLEMGIKLNESLNESPANFEVSGFDTAKNILLSKGYFSFQIIQELNKCTISKHLDLTENKYRNGGSNLHFYSQEHAFVIYDKVAEFNKDEKDKYKKMFSSNQEIIRLEVRLRSKTKIRHVLSKIGYNVDTLTFKDILNEELWKKILHFHWKGLIIDKCKFLFSKVNSVDILINNIAKYSPKIKAGEAWKLIAIYYTSKEKGLIGTRNIYEKILKGNNWSRLSKDFQTLNQMSDIQDCYGWFEEIDRALRFDK